MLNAHNWWHGVADVKAATKKTDRPLGIGVLSAANINFTALFDPADSHRDVVVTAVGARSLAKAQAQIDKYNVTTAKALGSYDEVLADPDIDAVYIPLPNALHCAWAIKAMNAGKHVLVEKPIASNAAQAKQILETSKKTGKVALEAYHWRFHPAAHRIKELVESGQYGAVQVVDARFYVSAGFIPAEDIRFQYELGGGACIDLAYVFSAALYYACDDPVASRYRILDAHPRLVPKDKDVDEAMEATIGITPTGKSAVTCKVTADMAQPKLFGIIPKLWDGTPTMSIELERARIDFPAFVGPWLQHTITITEKDGEGKLTKNKSTEQCYVGGPQWGEGRGARFWTTYRYQLEAFVDMVRASDAGRAYSGPDVPLGESVKLMELIDDVYRKADLPVRGA